MKTKVLKITGMAAATAFMMAACVKNPKICDPPKDPDPLTECNRTSKGTIEQCSADSGKWFINAYNYPGNSPIGPDKLLLPVNLPPAYKINALTVKFDYKLLPDSSQFNCGFCGTPPLPYIRHIRICNIVRDSNTVVIMKPVIYLYPTKKTKVSVDLRYKGRLTVTYPLYNNRLNGWEVEADKEGNLLNLADNTQHQYLFWEGTPDKPYEFNLNEGFCVKGSETMAFLQKTLPKLGLRPKEYNDMIVFWLPKMMNNPYNLIHFAKEEYTNSAPLSVSPKPDNVIRVFMAFKPSANFVPTHQPFISTPKRKGFTVVEWGGVELNADTNLPEPAL